MLCTYGSGDGEHRCFNNVDEIINLHTVGISEDIHIECSAAIATDILENLLCCDEFTLSPDFDYRLASYDEILNVILIINSDGVCSMKSV